MRGLIERVYPTRIRALRDLAVASFIGAYVFIVTPGWVYFKHQSILAILSAMTK